MAWLRHCIVCVLGISGLSHYYLHRHRGKLQHSWFLRIYSFFHNLLMLLGAGVMVHDLLNDDSTLRAELHAKSNQIRFSNMIFGFFNVAQVLACVHCAQLQQPLICRMSRQLKELELLYGCPASVSLKLMLAAKLSFLLVQQIIQLLGLVSQWSTCAGFQCVGSIWKFGASNLINAATLLIYTLLWWIIRCQWALQLRLQKLLSQRGLRPQQLQQVQMHQQLIFSTLAQFSTIFRHVLLWYLVRLGLNGVQSAYFLIRIKFGRSHAHLSWKSGCIISAVALHALAEFFALNSLAACAEELRLETLRILRQAERRERLLERCISAMALQLSFQSSRVHVFGILSLNRCLLFSLLAQTLEHTLYMIQNDYLTVM